MMNINQNRDGKINVWLVVGILGGVIVITALAPIVCWLWKVTVSDIFGVKPISYWQAWGLFLLCQILFKGNLSYKYQKSGK